MPEIVLPTEDKWKEARVWAINHAIGEETSSVEIGLEDGQKLEGDLFFVFDEPVIITYPTDFSASRLIYFQPHIPDLTARGILNTGETVSDQGAQTP
ncbi:hypothetical protein HYT18_03030 [Candidatus Microgenomates bacterium]|nr:hypothetical protein [Candidatus Microgenomates bacterium]